MITILSSPKPFVGIDKYNQYRAINNWKTLSNNVEIILYGNSAGIDDAGYELNVCVVKEIKSTNNGIPYFGSIVEHASTFGKYDSQMYLNCDILLSNLDTVISKIKFTNYLLIGQRIDLAEGVIVEESNLNFKNIVNKLYEQNKAKLHKPTGIDYFIFKRNQWHGIGEIVIGRGGYDNALLNFTKKMKFPIIDITNSVIALHQFHNYNHVIGNDNTVFYGSEAKNNLRLAGNHSLLTISDSDYIFSNEQILYIPCRGDKLRQFELYLRYKINANFASLLIRVIWRFLNYNKIKSEEA
jgi:hypothetical protein